MSKKVIQVTILHSRYDSRIYHKISKSLVKKYNVILLCADGKGNEINNLIEILDLRISKNNNFFLRILLNFKVIIKCFSLKGDCYHFHDPELIFAGILLRLFNYKVVFDSHEHIPDDILGKYYIPKNFRLITRSIYVFLEKFLLKFYSGLIGATPYIRDHLKKMNINVIDICNYPILDIPKLSRGKEVVKQPNDLNYICFVGGISHLRGVKELIKALELTKNKVYLNLVGDFISEQYEKELRAEKGWRYVNYFGYIDDRMKLKEIYQKSMIGIVTLLPNPNDINSLPIKMFEYMESQLPLIASDFDYFKEIFNEIKCGFNVNPRSPKDIAKAIDDLIDNPIKREEMAENGYKAIVDKFNWSIEEIKLLKFYKDLLK
jgi:glycosyltransferase involved in cell wall biosynthesis